MTAFATYANLVARLDGTIVAGLCGDAGVQMPGPNSIVDAALDSARGLVLAYARVGNMYTADAMEALAVAEDALLVTITVDLATEILYQRRGYKIPPAIEQRLKQAYTLLDGLQSGRLIFGEVEANANAGNPLVVSVPLANLGWYDKASNQPFFQQRRGSVYPA